MDATLLYRLFGSRLFPATGLWPAGVATAECILAGDRGGQRAALLGAGGLAGSLGYPLGIPMDIVGVCWIGNIWALFMFGLGLLVRGYASPAAGVDVNAIYLPHGVMIGAGLVAVIQIVSVVRMHDVRSLEGPMGAWLVKGLSAFAVAAASMALLAGLWTEMGPATLVMFVMFAAVRRPGLGAHRRHRGDARRLVPRVRHHTHLSSRGDGARLRAPAPHLPRRVRRDHRSRVRRHGLRLEGRLDPARRGEGRGVRARGAIRAVPCGALRPRGRGRRRALPARALLRAGPVPPV